MHKPATKPRTLRGLQKSPKEVEAIISPRNYSHLPPLGARGWFDILRRLYELSIDHKLNLHVNDPKIQRHNIAGKTRIFLSGAPVAQLVTAISQGVPIPAHLLPALVINIDAPDEIVLEEFTIGLALARRRFPPAFSRPGPRAPNNLFDVRTFGSWCNARIVQLAELLAWNAGRSARGLPTYPEHVLGEWIGLRDKSATNRAKATLRKALKSLPALLAC
jgi:hypothetical protein